VSRTKTRFLRSWVFVVFLAAFFVVAIRVSPFLSVFPPAGELNPQDIIRSNCATRKGANWVR